jgi:TonB-dependent receptor
VKSFKHLVLYTAVAGAFSSPVVAQDDGIDEVVVTGIRASLAAAVDIKRNNVGVVDAITAEDMGKFPDGNLAEALSRLVGVAIDRSNIEGSKVAVRGFGPEFNLVTLNGRQMPTVPGRYDGGRSFDFGDISAHGFESVQVFKTPTATLPTGGIGSTINIVTSKPLNVPGFKAAFSIAGVDDSTSVDGDIQPEADLVISNTNADGTIGVSLSASHSERVNREEGLQETTWFANVNDRWLPNAVVDSSANLRADGTVFTPEKAGFQIKDNERTRDNAQFTLQLSPSDRLSATLDYTYSNLDFTTEGNSFGVYLGGWNMASGTVNANGAVVESVYNDENTSYGQAATWGAEENTNKSLGINLEWQATENLTLTFDAHDSTSEKVGTDGDNSIGFINGNWAGWDGVYEPAARVDSVAVSFGPTGMPTYDLAVLNGFQSWNPVDELVAADMGSTNGTFSHANKKNSMQQTQLKADWVNVDGLFVDSLKSVQFGISQVNQKIRDTRARTEIIQGAANDGTDTVLNYVHYDDSIFTRTSLAGFMDDGSNGTNPESYYLAMDVPAARDAFARAGWGAGQAPWWAMNYGSCDTVDDAAGTGFTDLATGERGDLRCTLDPGTTDTDSMVEEKLVSAYAQFNFETEIQGLPLNASFGLRYEESDTISTALSRVASAVRWNVDGFSVVYGGDVPVPVKGSGSHILPNLNMSLAISDNEVIRFAASQSIARAGLNDMRSVLEFSSRAFGANIQATSGNADLEPLESNNFDIAYENYYAEGSYFAVNYFRKEIDGFLGSATNVGSSYGELTDPLYGEFAAAARADMEANGPRGDTPGWASDQQALWWNAMAQDGNAGICYGGGWVCPPEYMDGLPTDPLALIDFTQPVNSEDGVVDGWEIALQHQFGDSGFGANINATFVGGDVEADIYQLGDQFALPGFGDSANFAAFYEDDKWTATIAYNERGETYAGAEGQDHPIFVEERYQVDVTASYNVNDNLTLFAEARNITDEPVRLYVRHPEMIFLAQDHGPMYKFGLRANF